MDVSRRIVLYGNSLILGTLANSLRSSPQFEITTFAPPLPDTHQLAACTPDVVLFDLNSPYNEAVFPLLQTCPKVLLLGVSPDKNQVQMWAGQQLKELSTQGLMNIINEQLKVNKTF